jgi:hypothetical protein
MKRLRMLATAVGLLAAGAAAAQQAVPLPAPLPYPVPRVYVVPADTTPVDYYGAIAYQRETGAFGYSYDWLTQREAEVNALGQCGDPQCIVVTSFRSGCGALAVGARGAFAERGATQAEAETKALDACGDASCAVKAWSCTR